MKTETHTYNKYQRERTIVEQWTRPDGYTISVKTYHFKDKKAYTVYLGSSVIRQRNGYGMEYSSPFTDPVARRLTVESAPRFNANKMIALHEATVTPELIEKIETLLHAGAPVEAER